MSCCVLKESFLFIFILCTLRCMCEDSKTASRNVGTYECGIEEHPYIVPILLKRPKPEDTTYGFRCGGTLISSQWVLSAANCYHADKRAIRDYVVVAGITRLSHTISEIAQHRNIRNIVTGLSHDNDLALLKLDSPMRKARNVGFIKLPQKSLYPEDIYDFYSESLVIGWGMYSPMDSREPHVHLYSDHLMCVQLPLKKCKQTLQSISIGYAVTNKHVCTFYESGLKDFCHGAMGGPHICDGFQYGVISRRPRCADPNIPGVFTKVDKYVHWIKAVTRENAQKRSIAKHSVTLVDASIGIINCRFSHVLRLYSLFVSLYIIYTCISIQFCL